VSSVDPSWLRQIIEEDEHGLLIIPVKAAPVTRDERLVTAFKEICTFIETHGRAPEKNTSDVDEFQLHARLQAIVTDPVQREALSEYDVHGVLTEPEPPATIEEIFATDDAGLLDGGDDAPDIFTLTHIKEKVNLPDEIADRTRCEDFEQFEPLFKRCHAELKAGERSLIEFRNESQISEDSFFVTGGVIAYVAEIGDEKKEAGRRVARLRVIYENGTESNPLLRSFGRNLYKNGKRITEPNHTTLERMGLMKSTKMGVVYVLRSLSTDPQVVAIPDLHKIGFTTRTTADRIKQANQEKTYLNAPVEVVAEYGLPAAIASNVENLIHKFFAAARISVHYERNGAVVTEAKEWYSVPRDVINEVVELVGAGTIVNYEYDPATQTLRLRS
jgi:hypothetical protein